MPFATAAFFVPEGRPGFGLLEKGVSNLFRQQAQPLSDGLFPEIECVLHVPLAGGAGAGGGTGGGGGGGGGGGASLIYRGYRGEDEEVLEERMGAGLDALGWSKVGVRFRGLLPLSHNKIVALTGRSVMRKLLTPLWEEGKDTMRHCARFLCRRSAEKAGVSGDM